MMIHRITLTACLALTLGLLSALAIAKDPANDLVKVQARDQLDEPVILVATPQLRDQLYGASVLIVTPIGNRQHIGLIINRPTRAKLSDMFPDHAPSKKVTDPVFLGGPENRGTLFALVQRQGPASSGKIRLGSNLYLEMDRDKVDGVIENEYGQARFFAGVVVWRPGELATEIRNDYWYHWYVQDTDADLVLRKSTRDMWDELVKRIQRNKNTITAGNALLRVARD
jgi:putative transcriptional regulator